MRTDPTDATVSAKQGVPQEFTSWDKLGALYKRSRMLPVLVEWQSLLKNPECLIMSQCMPPPHNIYIYIYVLDTFRDCAPGIFNMHSKNSRFNVTSGFKLIEQYHAEKFVFPL